MTRSRLLAVLFVLLLPACGGGGAAPRFEPDPRGDDGENPPAVEGYLLVEILDDDDDDDVQDILDELVEETGATVLGPVPGTPYWRIALPAGRTMDDFEDELDDDVRVLNADRDVVLSSPEGDKSTLPAGGLLLASFIPDQAELARIGAPAARQRATGAGVRVAVLDTGVVDHEALLGRVDPDGWDFVDDDDDPTDVRDFLDDDGDGVADEGYGHGTFVASLILAIAPDARIVPFRVLNADALGVASTLATAITRAADSGVDVINLSAGMPDRLKVVQDAVHYARNRGVMVIASAGNTGEDVVNFPSAISSALSVTAVDAADHLADFASYGSEVDLSAPGVDLLGAFPTEVFPTGTARWSGTSFSAALASGGFALLRELFPGAEGDDLLSRLGDTSLPTEALNPTIGSRMGEGRLDLEAATRP